MHLFFDLDGTLTDSWPGISACINHALGDLGRAPEPAVRLRAMIGAPLTAIFEALLGSTNAVLIDRAVASYRVRFNDVGIFENRLFPGIAGALRELHEKGHALQVVTAKPAVSAGRVMKHFGLDAFFGAVHGPGLADRSCDKAELVGAALRLAGGDPRCAIMIGDRADDVLAARARSVRVVAAGWGYGSREELAAAGPDFTAESVDDLVRWIGIH